MSTQEKRLAVLIGVNKYEDNRLINLDGVSSDVQELYERLKDPRLGKFIIYRENECFNKEKEPKEPDAAFIREAMHDAFLSQDKYDVVLFYFAGHGFIDGYDQGYIAPSDVNLDKPFVKGIKMSDLQSMVSMATNLNKKTIIVILDCCYSGLATDLSRSSPTPFPVQKFQEEFGSEGKIILASGGSDQKSREIRDCKHRDSDSPHTHGHFTFRLIEALDGKAMDKNGYITFGKISDYIMENMPSDQRPKMLSLHDIGLYNIIIGKSLEKMTERKKEIINEVNNYIQLFNQKHNITYLCQAIKYLSQLKSFNIEDEISHYEKSIDICLKDYIDKIPYWLTKNENLVQLKLDNIKNGLYTDLYDLNNYFQHSELYKLAQDPLLECFFKAMCDVIDFQKDHKHLISRCKACLEKEKVIPITSLQQTRTSPQPRTSPMTPGGT
jgi:Caspase domain